MDAEQKLRAVVRDEVVAEIKAAIEKVAKGHDELAAKWPWASDSPDRHKASSLRRFAEAFL